MTIEHEPPARPRRWLRQAACLVGCVLWMPGLAAAGQISATGDLDPDDANSVALISFTLRASADVAIQTWGYGGTASAAGGANAAGTVIAAGGFDPMLALFAGIGDAAVWLASNDDGSCPPGDAGTACHDATLQLGQLAAGDYTLALSVFGNFSFAENYGGGTLGDGFVGLASYFDASSGQLRSSAWAVDIVSDGLDSGRAAPEPGSLALIALPLLGLLARRRSSRHTSHRMINH